MNIFNSDVKMYIYYVGKYSFRCGKRLFCENIDSCENIGRALDLLGSGKDHVALKHVFWSLRPIISPQTRSESSLYLFVSGGKTQTR